MRRKRRLMKPQASFLAPTVDCFFCNSQCAENNAGSVLASAAAAVTILLIGGADASGNAQAMEN